MAIVPKRKTSKQRRNKRRTHDALPVQNLVACTNCTQLCQQHRVCQHCGFYKNQKILGFKAFEDRKN